MDITQELIEDVAAELGINDPSLVEKDYFVIQALDSLSSYQSPFFNIIFAGGTCLSKTFINLQRMSEDVDLKLVLTDNGKALQPSVLKTVLSQLKKELSALFETAGFKFDEPRAGNGNQFIEYELEYTPIFDIAGALRPFLKIQLIVSELSDVAENHAITSLVNQVMNQSPEIANFSCVNVAQTAAEKMVALLRRTAARLNGINDWNDDALIRHIYDLHKISQHYELGAVFYEVVNSTVIADGKQYQNKYPAFVDNPVGEIKKALFALQTDAIFKQQYDNFLGPLVYSVDKPSYEEGLATTIQLAEGIWGSEGSNTTQ